jgi:hypothetical protein
MSFSDGDTVEIRASADGETLHVRGNHAADEGADNQERNQ